MPCTIATAPADLARLGTTGSPKRSQLSEVARVTEHRVEVAGECVDLDAAGQTEQAFLAVERQSGQPVGVVGGAGQVAGREQDLAPVLCVVAVREAMQRHHRKGGDRHVAAAHGCHRRGDVVHC
jgi:hypothetical protein